VCYRFEIRILVQWARVSIWEKINLSSFLLGSGFGSRRSHSGSITLDLFYVLTVSNCRQHSLESKQLHEMRELVRELKRTLDLVGVAPLPNQPRPDQPHLLLRLAIFGAFYPNYYVQVPGSLGRFYIVLVCYLLVHTDDPWWWRKNENRTNICITY
jgi:hypothetical protein